MRWQHLALSLSLLVICLPALAQADRLPALVTDRPGQTDSSSVVPTGAFQLELGWVHTESDLPGGDLVSDSLPQGVLRVGLTETLELRVGINGYVKTVLRSTGGGRTEADGLGDALVGIKVALTDEGKHRPEMALVVASTLPVGGSEVTSDRADPLFRVAFSNSLTDRFSVGYNVGAAWRTEQVTPGVRDTTSVAQWTASLGIAGPNDEMSFFVEAFGETGLSADGPPENAIDGGMAYRIKPNLQLDASAGFGVSDAAADWFVNFGLTYRFLPK